AAITREDANLLNCLEKLELDVECATKVASKEPQCRNPFLGRRRSKSLSSINLSTVCDHPKKNQNIKHTISFKRPTKKILREPVLKFLKCTQKMCGTKAQLKKIHKERDKQFGQCASHLEQNFRSIINACEQLSIENSYMDLNKFRSPSFLTAQQQDDARVVRHENTNTNMGSCSHQARLNINPPCDVTIDELASYFETFVHIPKKMSSMAEMIIPIFSETSMMYVINTMGPNMDICEIPIRTGAIASMAYHLCIPQAGIYTVNKIL
ncbi:unnamed protein product, partial [Acanthoscelides obtectus]